MLKNFTGRISRFPRDRSFQTLNRIELHAAAMIHNVQLVQHEHPGFCIIPVLKSNAYGHGIEQVAQILNAVDCDFLAIDGYYEAAKIRRHTKHRLLIMGYILPENTPLLDTNRCSFVVQDLAGLKAFGALHRPVKIHVELNTGFNRLGLQPKEIPQYIQTLKKYRNLELEGVMTHLIDADNEQDNSLNVSQQQHFDALVAQIRESKLTPKFIHIAQTAGSPKIESTSANAIRLGIGTYGINPLLQNDPYADSLNGLQPVLEMKSTIIKVIDLQPGEQVSYNATFSATQPMRIGVLPLGYYEGIPRDLSNKGCVTNNARELPIIGRVCMNHTMIDLTNSDLENGDEVTVISRDPNKANSILGMRNKFGLFPYTTMTGLASTTRRVII